MRDLIIILATAAAIGALPCPHSRAPLPCRLADHDHSARCSHSAARLQRLPWPCPNGAQARTM